MGRGARLFLLCVVALALSAAQHPKPTAQGQKAQPSQGVTNALQNVTSANDEKAERAHRAKYEAQCNPTNEKRDSDLCAQWKAADAATKAAKWAKIGTWVGGLSGVLVLIALGFAFEANRIARQTAK